MDPAAAEIQYRRHAIPVDILDELAARKVSARRFDNESARLTKIELSQFLKFFNYSYFLLKKELFSIFQICSSQIS
jgi:hypothetical protein